MSHEENLKPRPISELYLEIFEEERLKTLEEIEKAFYDDDVQKKIKHGIKRLAQGQNLSTGYQVAHPKIDGNELWANEFSKLVGENFEFSPTERKSSLMLFITPSKEK